MGRLKFTHFVMIIIFHASLNDCSTLPDDENNNQLDDNWVVQTSSGLVEGTVEVSIDNHEVYVFYGIPYAEPPVGELRFKPPEPVKHWTEVLKATKQPLPCFQALTGTIREFISEAGGALKRPWTEDCLTLNIWVPKPVVQDSPVLVVIHPGFFLGGSNSYPDGKVLSVHAQDVIVSMNYRLGAFGFLNLGVPGAPGNAGLMDQQLALKWIHENIHHFGGKTDAVILIGAGNAGGASAGYHLLSTESSKYFKTIAPFSGAPTCQWAFQSREKSLKKSRDVSRLLGCESNSDTEEELKCLRNAHPEDIVDADVSHMHFERVLFAPTVDGTFITETPVEALEGGRFKKAAVLLSFNAQEGSIPLSIFNQKDILNIDEGMSIQEFRKAVTFLHPTLSGAEMSIIEDYYIDKCGEDDQKKIRGSAIEVYSDVLVGCCISRFVEYLSSHGSEVFLSLDDIRKESTPSWHGSSHGISVQYAFGYPLIDDGFNEAEKNLSAYFMTWINEHSKKKASEMGAMLELYNTEDKAYTLWNMEGPQYLNRYREDQCKLWGDIIPKFQKRLREINNSG